MERVIPDPAYNSFDGVYIGSTDEFVMPPNEYDLSGIANHMRKTHKEFHELTEDEIKRFKFHV